MMFTKYHVRLASDNVQRRRNRRSLFSHIAPTRYRVGHSLVVRRLLGAAQHGWGAWCARQAR